MVPVPLLIILISMSAWKRYALLKLCLFALVVLQSQVITTSSLTKPPTAKMRIFYFVPTNAVVLCTESSADDLFTDPYGKIDFLNHFKSLPTKSLNCERESSLFYMHIPYINDFIQIDQSLVYKPVSNWIDRYVLDQSL